jgi:hypothetical protein
VPDEQPSQSERDAVRRFYRTIKGPNPTRDDFLSDQARGNDPPAAPGKRRYWQGLSAFDSWENARAVARRVRSQGDHIAEVTIPASGAITYERWGRNPGHHTIWGDPDDLMARVTAIQPVFLPDEEYDDGDNISGLE